MTDKTAISRFFKQISRRVKETAPFVLQKTRVLLDGVKKSERIERLIESLKWRHLRPRLISARDIVVRFTLEQPKTAAFMYVCLFCAFSIGFLDEPFALSRLGKEGFAHTLAAFNPSGWWFLILAALWLFYMAVAGLSLTTDVFERNLVKARRVLFVAMTLGLSSVFTLIANILTGRYTPEFLETMNLYGFSALRFNVAETSFPAFGVQSLWAVAAAAASFMPKTAKIFFIAAFIMTVAVVFAAKCFISDAAMGAYIGVIAYYAAVWIKSENRENTPLISL